MAEAEKALSDGEVRAIVLAGAKPPGPRDPQVGHAGWRERGIPIIDVANDNGSAQRSTIEIVLLDVLRNAHSVTGPPPAAGDPASGATPR
jgi:hypothetical protein